MNNYQRIMIFGRPGSGKSTFSLKLSDAQNLPLFHLDKYFFEENWIERDYNEFIEIQKSLVFQDKWIIDGNSVKSLELRYSRANLALYFNYPRFLSLYRCFKRFFKKNKRIDDRANNCDERIRWVLVKYLWTFEKRVKEPLKILRNKYPNVEFIEINNDNDLEKLFLDITINNHIL